MIRLAMRRAIPELKKTIASDSAGRSGDAQRLAL